MIGSLAWGVLTGNTPRSRPRRLRGAGTTSGGTLYGKQSVQATSYLTRSLDSSARRRASLLGNMKRGFVPVHKSFAFSVRGGGRIRLYNHMSEKMASGLERKESEPVGIVAVQFGKTAGIRWVRGYALEIDPATEKIVSVKPALPEWTESELMQDAVQMASVDDEGNELDSPKVGDSAPEGWHEWRR